jgi:hypothetical protein
MFLIFKKINFKNLYWAGGVAQVVECLPSKFKASVQFPIPPKEQKLIFINVFVYCSPLHYTF